jgi:valyl-tRNA synthetase
VNDFSLVQEIVRAVRNLRTEKKVTPGKRISATIAAGERLPILLAQSKTIAALAHIDPQNFTLLDTLIEKPQDQASLVVAGIEVYLPLSGLVDLVGEQMRLQKELDETQSQIERLEGLLSSPFGQKAPAVVVDKERQKLVTFQETAASLREQLQALK